MSEITVTLMFEDAIALTLEAQMIEIEMVSVVKNVNIGRY